MVQSSCFQLGVRYPSGCYTYLDLSRDCRGPLFLTTLACPLSLIIAKSRKTLHSNLHLHLIVRLFIIHLFILFVVVIHKCVEYLLHEHQRVSNVIFSNSTSNFRLYGYDWQYGWGWPCYWPPWCKLNHALIVFFFFSSLSLSLAFPSCLKNTALLFQFFKYVYIYIWAVPSLCDVFFRNVCSNISLLWEG